MSPSGAHILISSSAHDGLRGTDEVMLSVVLPLYNGADTIEDQLIGLSQQVYAGPWELIIADNGSRDGSQDIARSWAARRPNIRIIDASARRGSAAADNIGASAARGHALVFCDQDDVVQPGWLEAMAMALEDHDLVAGRNEFEILDSDAHPLRGRKLRPTRRRRTRTAAADFYGFLPWGLSCNLGVSRRAFEAVGGFDENLRGGDDVDLCWRIQLAGYAIHFEPHAVVAKRHRATFHGIWDQHFNYGVHDAALFKKFRADGMPRRLGRAVRRYGWLALHVIDISRPAKRYSWTRVAAAQAGRVVGSLRQRTVYL
jgi:GT2 family glycosyltransferase